MAFVAVWEVLEAIQSKVEVSRDERASTLRLADEVPVVAPNARSLFKGMTLGDLRNEVVAGLAEAFAQAHTLSWSAAVLENALHHTDTPPRLFDLRQTGLPRLSSSVFDELRPVLFGVAQFETRLIGNLSSGKFRNYPRHGGGRPGVSPYDWTSHPSDGDTLKRLAFLAEEIEFLLRKADIPFSPLRDLFTGEQLESAHQNVSPAHCEIAPSGGRSDLAQPLLELLPIEEREEARTDGFVARQSASPQRKGGTPRRFTDDDLAFIKQRKANGESWKEIAADLDMAEKTLEGHITKYNKRMRTESIRGDPFSGLIRAEE